MNVNQPEIPHGTEFTDKELTKQWNSIDWNIVQETVNNLQLRIARAANDRKWYRVYKLSRLLTNSYHAKLLAVKTVTSNKGGRTPGIDGVIWKSASDKMNAVLNLSDKGYRAKPLKRIYIPKKNGKLRPLSIPTLKDRAMQMLHLLALAPIEASTGDRSSFGFRKFRSTHDACKQLFSCLSSKNSAQWILEGDIRGCFDNISHEWLLKHIPMKKSVLNQFLKAGFVFSDRLFPTKAGTPQGSSISPTLANMALNGIQTLLGLKFFSSKKGRIYKSYNIHKINYVRYADDFVVTADSIEILEEIKAILTQFLKERGLELSEEKTLITHISDGFDFLSWNFRKYNGKMLVKPSKESIKRVKTTIKDTFHLAIAWPQDAVISKLNPLIRGWANYHKRVAASAILNDLDKYVWDVSWTWAKRRHQSKPKRWIAKRYWKRVETRNWIFAGEKQTLVRFFETKIRYHTPLKLDMNPFIDKVYFEKRKGIWKGNSQTRLSQFSC